MTALRSIFSRSLGTSQRRLLVAGLLFLLIIGSTQDLPAHRLPAAEFQPRAYAIIKGRVVTEPGQVLESGTVIIRDGLIVAVGADLPLPPDAERIDATGLTIYPGFIDAGTSSLLTSDAPATPLPGAPVDVSRSALAATLRDNRKSLTPEYRAFEHLKLDHDVLEKRRQAGFTVAHVLPEGRLAAGTGTLVSLHSTVAREAILAPETSASLRVFAPGDGGYPSTLMGGTAHLRQAFLDARYQTVQQQLFATGAATVPRPVPDPVLAALQQLLTRQRTAWFTANSRDELGRAMQFGQEFELPWTLWGGRDIHRVIDRLPALAGPLVLTVDYGPEPQVKPHPTATTLDATDRDSLRLQTARQTRWREQVAGPQQLLAKGLKFAVSSQGTSDPAEVLTGVRAWIAQGLPAEAALAAMTRDAALAVGQEQRLGTITVGKLGHLVVMTGPFDDDRSRVRYVLAEGRKFEYHKDATPVPPKSATPTQLTLTGTWHLEITAPDQPPVTAKLVLTQTNDRLTGTFDSPQGDGKLTAGTVSNLTADWTVAIGVGARTLELKFTATGTLEQPQQLSGTLKSAFGGTTNWTAKRDVPAANPVAIGLDTDPDALPMIVELPTELEVDRLTRKIQTGGNVFIKNGTVLTGRGERLPETSILVQQGKIAAIGRDLQPPADITVIDATGRFVMPGIIDTHSHIMIGDGLGGVNEATLSIVPEVRVKDALWTTDVSAYRALAGGTTTARLFHGSANVIGGQDAVVQLKYGAPAHEQVLPDAPQGVKFALGENVKFQQRRFPNTRMGVEATLNRAFLEALDYRRQWLDYNQKIAADPQQATLLLPPRRDLRLEALMDIVNQQKFIHSHCYRADEILMLLRVAEGLGVRVWSLQHVLEGYKVAPEIKAHGASCSTFSDWWAYKIEAYDATPYNAALLHQTGINTVIKSDDWELIRHLYLEAAKTMRYGDLPPDVALQLITINPANELGLADRIGSLEVGKQADIAIFNGHPLHAFSRCEQTLIAGEIYFTRADQPTAMSEAGAARQHAVAEIPILPPEVRGKTLDLTESPAEIYALTGGTIHPVDTADIASGTVLVQADRIVAVGADVALPPNTKLIDVTGLHVYPGLIDPGTTLGLTEIGKVKETHDFDETGLFQPDLRAGVAINPDSELIPVARAGGITTVLATPLGGRISGQASAVRLGGWTVPEMVLDLEVGLSLRWPTTPTPFPEDRSRPTRRTQPSVDEQEKARQKELDDLREFFQQARLYLELKANATAAQQPLPIADSRFEALAPYLNGSKPVLFEAHQRREIAEAILFAEEQKLKLIITGGTDAWKLADVLKSRKIPVIVGPVMRSPTTETDPFDAPYANPGRLFEAGVAFCIRSDDASNSRNVPFEAAQAVAYGLPAEEALKSVTLHAAQILGLDQQIGSITPGKLANLVITDGSPLLPSTQIKGTFISGRPYSLDNRQLRFYEKYRQRITPPPAVSAP